MALALAASLLAQFAKPATAALTREALAWGNGPFGELGNGTTSVESPPVEVSNLGAVKAISAGCNHALALQEDGTVWAWGDNSHGQLGNGTSGNGSQGPDTFSNVPVKVSNLDGVKAISAGNTHSLALTEDGTVRAGGGNFDGQLGNAAIVGTSATPVKVKTSSGDALDNIRAIAAGTNFSLAIRQ